MLNLGIPLGCPRTYLNSGEMIKIGNWTDRDCRRADKFADDLWSGVRVAEHHLSPAIRDGENFFPEEDISVAAQEMDNGWDPYTWGCYEFNPRLDSPRNISWSIDQVRENPSLDGFAKLFHELSLLLPINPLDEIRNRLENPTKFGEQCRNLERVPDTSDKFHRPYPVAEVSEIINLYISLGSS